MARTFRRIKAAFGTSHSVRALVEEIVSAVTVAKIVEFPRFLSRLSVQNSLSIDENVNRADIACKISGVAEGLRHFRGADVQVMLGGVGPFVAQPALEFK